MKKKDVFVWVARDKFAGFGDPIDCTYFHLKKPKLTKGYFHNTYRRGLNSLFGLKPTQCKKYKLVEVKE